MGMSPSRYDTGGDTVQPQQPQSFLRGAFILAAAGLVVKLLGAFYRIPFTRLVGSEGVGLYQMAYPIYITLIALSTSGIPIAISMLVAEKGARGDRFGARQVFLLALAFLFLFGLLLTIGLYHSAHYLAESVLGDARAYYSLVSIAPAILVISVASAFRGYFQGWQLMWPTALSEVIEQCIRVGTVLWAAYVLLDRGVEFAAAGAAFGAFTGGCGGLLVLVCLLLWFERGLHRQFRPGGWSRALSLLDGAGQLLKRLLLFALPISAGSLVLPLVQTIDAIIIPHRLQTAGFSYHQATAMFGELSGMAGTLVYLPAVFTVSLAVSLVPNIASALARGRTREINERVATAIRVTILFCLPAAVGLIVLATPLASLLFADRRAGVVTAWLAPYRLFFRPPADNLRDPAGPRLHLVPGGESAGRLPGQDPLQLLPDRGARHGRQGGGPGQLRLPARGEHPELPVAADDHRLPWPFLLLAPPAAGCYNNGSGRPGPVPFLSAPWRPGGDPGGDGRRSWSAILPPCCLRARWAFSVSAVYST